MKKNDERGMSLVELLAVMVLSGMMIVILLTSFGIAAKHNAVESEKLKMQQDMNLLISQLTQQHRSGECYVLKGSAAGLTQIVYEHEGSNRNSPCGTVKAGPDLQLAENYSVDVHRYSKDLSDPSMEPWIEMDETSDLIDPRLQNLRIRISLTNASGRKLEQETTLSRYKEDIQQGAADETEAGIVETNP